jgi:hypothetical protein
MRRDAAALPPSTARKALVMATPILSGSKPVILPLRRMTLMPPGAVAATAAVSAPPAGGAGCGAGGIVCSVSMGDRLLLFGVVRGSLRFGPSLGRYKM